MEQQRQKGINFRPFVGSKYTNSRYGIRVMVLGCRLWEEVPNLPPKYPIVWCSIIHPGGGMAHAPSITALAESIVKASGIFIKDKDQL